VRLPLVVRGQAAECPLTGEPVDLIALSLAEYAATVRGQLGIEGRGMNNVGHALEHEKQTFRGHTRDEQTFPESRDAITSTPDPRH
jgi:hypothetical protein